MPERSGCAGNGAGPRRGNCGNRRFLADAKFDHQMAAESEQMARLSRNGAVGIESIGPAVQCDAGIVRALRAAASRCRLLAM